MALNKAFQRGLVIGMSMQQSSVSDIARELHISKRTIYRWIEEYRNGKKLPNKSPGRPKKTTPRSDRLICRLAVNNNLCSASQLRQQWQERVSTMTVYRRLKSAGIRSRRRARVPYLSPANVEARLHWSMARAAWRAVWDRVIFSDESRFCRFGNDGRIRVWRKKGDRLLSRNVTTQLQAGGGSVHVWGAIWRSGRSQLIFLEGAVNQRSYIETLTDFFRTAQLPENPIFQHDNAPAHTAARVHQFLENSGVRSLPWPSRSPDLNPIEHVWDAIGQKINTRPHPAESIAQLRNWILQEWGNLAQEYLDNLVASLPRRVRAVIEAHGRHTKY